MRCPDCNKFVGLELGDPEVNNVDVDADGNITAEVRIVRNCADCGTELKEASFQLEGFVDVGDHKGTGHELDVNEDSCEATERSDGKPNTPSRYRRSFFGVELQVSVTCSCGGEVGSVTLTDEVQASDMDELT